MLAKVKLTQDIGRWRIEGRTVIHQSWAGYTWRKKGSDLAYYEGCTFPPAPPPPPPPPPAPIIWTVAVDAYEPGPFVVVVIFGVSAWSEVQGLIGTQVIERRYEGVEIPMMTIEIVSLQFSRDYFEKVYHIIFGPPEEPFLEDFVTLSAPPFNNLPMPQPTVDSQSHQA